MHTCSSVLLLLILALSLSLLGETYNRCEAICTWINAIQLERQEELCVINVTNTSIQLSLCLECTNVSYRFYTKWSMRFNPGEDCKSLWAPECLGCHTKTHGKVLLACGVQTCQVPGLPRSETSPLCLCPTTD